MNTRFDRENVRSQNHPLRESNPAMQCSGHQHSGFGDFHDNIHLLTLKIKYGDSRPQVRYIQISITDNPMIIKDRVTTDDVYQNSANLISDTIPSIINHSDVRSAVPHKICAVIARFHVFVVVVIIIYQMGQFQSQFLALFLFLVIQTVIFIPFPFDCFQLVVYSRNESASSNAAAVRSHIFFVRRVQLLRCRYSLCLCLIIFGVGYPSSFFNRGRVFCCCRGHPLLFVRETEFAAHRLRVEYSDEIG